MIEKFYGINGQFVGYNRRSFKSYKRDDGTYEHCIEYKNDRFRNYLKARNAYGSYMQYVSRVHPDWMEEDNDAE